MLREQQAAKWCHQIAPRCSSTNATEKKVAELKAAKSAAVEAEDYYTARRIKRELESLITCGDKNNLVQRQSQASATDMDYGRHEAAEWSWGEEVQAFESPEALCSHIKLYTV